MNWKKIAAWLSVVCTASAGTATWAGQLPHNVGTKVMLVTGLISAVLPGILGKIEEIEKQ
jgi:hypothetical protein